MNPLVGIKAPGSDLTWVFASTAPFDEADDEEDQYDQGDGTHQADEPALSCDIYLVYVGWRHETQSGTGGERTQ